MASGEHLDAIEAALAKPAIGDLAHQCCAEFVSSYKELFQVWDHLVSGCSESACLTALESDTHIRCCSRKWI